MKVTSGFFTISLLLGMSSMPLMLQAQEEKDQQAFTVQLYSLNGSGVTGEADIEIKNGATLKVELEATGLEANKPHPQHIHGLSRSASRATCPDSSADINADGLVSVGEGAPFYGPIVLPLNPFDLVGADTELRYEASLTINSESIQPLGKRVIVLHGMTVNGEYIASLPIACGQVDIDD